jgi:hypothetical protein
MRSYPTTERMNKILKMWESEYPDAFVYLVGHSKNVERVRVLADAARDASAERVRVRETIERFGKSRSLLVDELIGELLRELFPE